MPISELKELLKTQIAELLKKDSTNLTSDDTHMIADLVKSLVELCEITTIRP